MKFHSTRDASKVAYDSAVVIKQGLAADGGLFVPDSIPTLTAEEIESLRGADYATRAAVILGKYLTDYTHEELLEDCRAAYADTSFVGGAAPLVAIDDTVNSLELWHGPTAAFKDMALQIMPRLLSRALVKTNEKRTALILVATSGDTGKAALEGYRDIPGVQMLVFYPVDGVSRVQKLQMATQLGENVDVCAIHGNFDDAQNGVKRIFADSDAAAKLNEQGYFLSSANSINWGRLAPQIAYYVSAWLDLLNAGKCKPGETFNVCVPTGNFGNIFAAYLAKRMGVPIGRLICASNKNNILTDFLATGTYDRNRAFYTTTSPSMDILISSNLERLLYFTAGSDATAAYMKSLGETGAYTVSTEVKAAIDADFCGYFADEEKTADVIRRTWEDRHYLCDTHTAVGLACAEQYIAETGDRRPMVLASTASPYKFAADVLRALGGEVPADELDALDALTAMTGVDIPYPLCGLAQRKVRFTEVCNPADMLNVAYNKLK
ncbi:MAG: threonine synthase [Clostridia bacterium]|nr:threonine synthase [Clostridia bacterium]